MLAGDHANHILDTKMAKNMMRSCSYSLKESSPYIWNDPGFTINIVTTATGAYIDKIESWLDGVSGSGITSYNTTPSTLGYAGKRTNNATSATLTSDSISMSSVSMEVNNLNKSLYSTIIVKGYDTLGNTAQISIPIALHSGVVP